MRCDVGNLPTRQPPLGGQVGEERDEEGECEWVHGWLDGEQSLAFARMPHNFWMARAK
jgi:hypothetical protein